MAINIRASLLNLSKSKAVYMIYKNDDLLGFGTVQELHEQFGMKPQTIYAYATPSRVAQAKISGKRLYAVRLKE